MALSESIISRLRHQHTVVQTLTANRSKAQLEQHPIPGKWSALEQIAHLAAYQPVFIARLEKMSAATIGAAAEATAASPEPTFERYAANNDPHFHECTTWSPERLSQSLIANGRIIVGTLEAFSPQTLQRKGRHPLYGLLTIEEWTEFYLLHEAHHLFHIFMLTKTVHL